ncbi:ATP-binding protein [Nonomuraea sp. NPDC050153]|uniref:ATP-binding protein n=1 Tax=Nonomuraea sp. NPDC050153 TaxID=3364359 RepID=UPI0037A0AAC1
MPAMLQPRIERGTTEQQPALRLLSWNGLLAMGDGLAVRAGWAGQDRAVSWLLSARPSAVPGARRMTAVRLADWGLHEQAETADLLVGALVANALRHAGTRIRLSLWVEDGLLRCEVEDDSPLPAAVARCRAAAQRAHDPVLARLACCWGVAGKVVWFELVTGERSCEQHA